MILGSSMFYLLKGDYRDVGLLGVYQNVGWGGQDLAETSVLHETINPRP